MIIDTFTFCHEIDLLKLRTNYLKDSVNYFIIAEANESHSGIKKTLVLKEIIEKKELDIPYEKIILISIIDLPPIIDNNCWPREAYTRFKIKEYLLSMGLNNDDMIMYSDIDEFPRKEFIGYNKGVFIMDTHLYWLDAKDTSNNPWYGTVILPFSEVKNIQIQQIRELRMSYQKIGEGAGWHFTYMNGDDSIKRKVEYSAHKEQDKIDGTFLNGHLERKNKFIDLIEVPLDNINLPDYLINNLLEFKNMIKQNI